jgi:poly(3-hydroxybutyrate) depolymerase
MHPKRNGARITLSVVAGASLLAGGLLAVPAQAAEGDGAEVIAETLDSGNDFFVYVPSGDTGYRAASTPILLVFGDTKFTAESAKTTAQESGLAEIAVREQGVVAFINPEGEDWASTDSDAVTSAFARFGDSTGQPYADAGKLCSVDFLTQETVCKYPGAKSRVYLFADGAGADFVNQSVVKGLTIVPPFSPPGTTQTWTPTAIFSANATAPAVTPPVDIDVPAYLVNAAPVVEESFSALNSSLGLYASVTSPVVAGFDKEALLAGYDEVIEQAIHRTAEVNDSMQMYTIPDFAAEGIDVTHASANVSTGPLEYFQYLPDTADLNDMPLVLTFHGGGNHAEYHMWSTGWPEIAKANGFMTVSVNRHVGRSANDVIELLDMLLEKYPGIDESRVYATGFSMGSVKTWDLAEQYPTRFAAFAPMGGSFGGSAIAADGMTPAIYFAGLASPLPERPHQNGAPNDIDSRIAAILGQNDVTDSYVYDAAADPTWGIAADATATVVDDQFDGVSVEVDKFKSHNGGTYTALAAVTNGSHEPLNVEAEIAWDFMSQFSRNSDGSVNTTEAPIATVAPEVTGSLDVGTRATATPGSWNIEGLTYSYQWLRNGEPIVGATKATYTVRASDQGAALSVRVAASGAGFAIGEAVSAERTVRALAYAIVTTNKLIGSTSTSFTVNVKVTAANGAAVNGPITIKVGSKAYAADVADGKASVVIGTQKRGIHLIVASLPGTETVSPTTGVGVILVR